MPKKKNILTVKAPQDFPRHSERSEESQKEIAQGVDLCETASVPLRNDMAFRHPELQLLLYASCNERYKGGCLRVDSGSIIGVGSQHVKSALINAGSKVGWRQQCLLIFLNVFVLN